MNNTGIFSFTVEPVLDTKAIAFNFKVDEEEAIYWLTTDEVNDLVHQITCAVREISDTEPD